MKMITAPDASLYPPSIFLGGGISNCGDWQSEFAERLSDLEIILFNPRRVAFDLQDPSATVAQIHWEFRFLRNSDAVLFWFPKTSICPITLFEIGAMTREAGRPIFVGMDPDYPRRIDIEIQIPLLRSDIELVYNFDDMEEQVRKWHEVKTHYPWMTGV